MGKRGPKSSADGGYGTLNAKGYRRVWCTKQRRYRMEHVVVWEAAHGPVPKGHQVHHKNENKLDNRLENLELVTPLEHKRLHGGCELRNGKWWKPCRRCKQWFPVAYYYKQGKGITTWCKACCVRSAVAYKKKRRG